MSKLRQNSPFAASGGGYYYKIDCWRVACAIGIMILHLEPFSIFNPVINYAIVHVIARICVPFFFLTSGFFIEPIIKNKEKLYKYIFKTLKMYLICTVLYIPVLIDLYLKEDTSLFRWLINFTKSFFFIGSYQHLWYFVSLIWAVILLYLLVSRCSNEKIRICIIIILYIIGTIGNAYHKTSNLYYKFFGTTRNGLFMGLPFVFLGYTVRKNEHKIKKSKILYLFLTNTGFVLMGLEAIFIYCFFNKHGQDMLLFLLPTALCMFISIVVSCQSNIATKRKQGIGKYYRDLSVLIFELHLLVNALIKKMEVKFDITINNLLHFIVVLLITTMAANIIIFFSKQRFGKCIKNLYC